MASTVGRRHKLLHARVPVLLVQRRGELVALEALVGLGEAVGLHDLERIGRGHEHLREQRIGIERDRRDKLIELPGIEQILLLLRDLLVWNLLLLGLDHACGEDQHEGRQDKRRKSHNQPPHSEVSVE